MATMKNCLVFDSNGFRDYEFWQSNNPKIVKKINALIRSIHRDGPNKGDYLIMRGFHYNFNNR